MNPTVGMLFIVTKDFDAMRQFFVDLGLDVKPDHPGMAQVTPLLNCGRGCLIVLPSLMISLEESTDVLPSGPLYMQIEGIDEARLLSMKGKYSIKHIEGGFYGDNFYAIKPPGGGLVHALPA
jgi:hypothetical protein